MQKGCALYMSVANGRRILIRYWEYGIADECTSGELSVEIPVKICHPASLTPAPAPKLDQNHLPHQYNLVDENLDLESDVPTRSNRRIGSNASLSAPITSGYDPGNSSAQTGNGRELPWASDGAENDEGFSIGRQGEPPSNNPPSIQQ